MNTYRLYEVGGAVRDSLLGLKSKDIDYTVVVTPDDPSVDAVIAFNWFHAEIVRDGYEVFLCTPDVFTIRARFPKTHIHAGLVADFVLARKESGFVEGTRRPLNIELGTLEDDLRRRDFTVNAIARDIDGTIIDPFNGMSDLCNRILICPVDAETSFEDDPLRILRALRFSLTKEMNLGDNIKMAIKKFDVDRFIETVSIERIREELHKMFSHSTINSLKILFELEKWNFRLYEYIFEQLWLKPTTENK
tara:strand:+ start:1344 stop:2090 length:747 start_codon:yes stop_codon:yes gene_type:complete